MRFTSSVKMLWEIYGEPIAETLGIYETSDRSYGRWKIPFSAMEKRLHENPEVEVTFHKVLLDNGKDWVWYQVWQDPVAIQTTGRNADMIFVHGTGVHSGTLASQCHRYLSAGFRLLVPDLPSHGYSSGLHVYQNDIYGYTSGLHAVLHDVARRDQLQSPFPNDRLSKQERKETFMLGLSFGGLVAFSYALHYPGSYRYEASGVEEIPIDGIVGVGPMVEHNHRSVRISPVLMCIFWFMYNVLRLARLEVMVPHKKVVDKDPKVYESLIMQDPRSHQGSFRLGHLYSIRFGMSDLQRRAHEIKHPVYIQAGGQDLVADNEVALAWMKNISSDDKRFEVYPVCQHVIYKKGRSEHDDLAGRVTVIADNVDWMCQRLPLKLFRPRRNSSYVSEDSDISRQSYSDSLFDEEQLTDSASELTSGSLPSTPIMQEDGTTFVESLSVSCEPFADDMTLGIKSVQHPLGWEVDAKGEKRLYRQAWNYKEDTRPFLLNCYRS